MTNNAIARTYIRAAYANSLIIIAQTTGVGKSAVYSALIYTKTEGAALLARLLRLERTSPKYKVRTRKTGHFRLDQCAVRCDYAENGAAVFAQWRRAEYDALREQFYAEQNACTLKQHQAGDPRRVLTEGHFGEWLICRELGIPWVYNTTSYRKGADVELGEFSAEVKTTTNGAAQWQPGVNQYL